jgi:hypothetical protein
MNWEKLLREFGVSEHLEPQYRAVTAHLHDSDIGGISVHVA